MSVYVIFVRGYQRNFFYLTSAQIEQTLFFIPNELSESWMVILDQLGSKSYNNFTKRGCGEIDSLS